MKKVVPKLLPLLVAAIALTSVLVRCSSSPVSNGRTETGEPKVAGVLYNADGSRAVGVAVNLYSANFTPSMAKLRAGTGLAKELADSVVLTDAQGHYSLPLPDSGVYNLVGVAGDGKSVFIDSVIVKDTNSVEVPPDTVTLPGKISGVSFMPGLDAVNQIRVTLFMPGTNFITKPNIGGAFSFSQVPRGTYQLLFDPTYTDYYVKVLTVTVKSGAVTNLDTVLLYGANHSGLPFVNAGNDTAAFIKDTVHLHGSAVDTFGRITKLEWDIGATGRFAPTLTGDTFFVASSTPDTNFACLFRATDNDGNVVTDTVRVRIIQVTPVVNAGNDTTVSVKDTVHLHGGATFAHGKIVRLEWDIGGSGTFRTSATGDTTFVSSSTPDNDFKCILRATGEDSTQATDTVHVKILKDPPVMNAGNDTTVSIKDSVHLHGRATYPYGKIVKLEWDIGKVNNFKTVLTGDTTFAAPSTPNNDFMCVFRATDDDNVLGYDTVHVKVALDPPVANAGNDTSVSIGDHLLLHGSATQQFGTIAKWEWNVGNSGFVKTSSNDTVVGTPDSMTRNYPCVLRITDDDDNIALDTMIVHVGPPAPRLLWPADGEGGIVVNPDSFSLKWQDTLQGFMFNVQVFDSTKALMHDDSLESVVHSYYCGLHWQFSKGATYFWRVRILAVGTNASNDIRWNLSDWSDLWKFTTAP